jgi:hypothetical protein
VRIFQSDAGGHRIPEIEMKPDRKTASRGACPFFKRRNPKKPEEQTGMNTTGSVVERNADGEFLCPFVRASKVQEDARPEEELEGIFRMCATDKDHRNAVAGPGAPQRPAQRPV